MALPLPAERLHAVLSECLRRNRLRNATLRLTITRGSGTPGDLAPQADPAQPFHYGQADLPAQPLPSPSGVAAVVIRRFRADRRGVPPTARQRAGSWGSWPAGKRRAPAPSREYLNEKGEITEGTTTNVFWVRKGNAPHALPSAPASGESREPSHWRPRAGSAYLSAWKPGGPRGCTAPTRSSSRERRSKSFPVTRLNGPARRSRPARSGHPETPRGLPSDRGNRDPFPAGEATMNKVQSAEDLASRIEASLLFPGATFTDVHRLCLEARRERYPRRLRQSRLRPLGRRLAEGFGDRRRGRHFIPARGGHDADPRHRGDGSRQERRLRTGHRHAPWALSSPAAWTLSAWTLETS